MLGLSNKDKVAIGYHFKEQKQYEVKLFVLSWKAGISYIPHPSANTASMAVLVTFSLSLSSLGVWKVDALQI